MQKMTKEEIKRGRGRPPKPEGPDPSVLLKFPRPLLKTLDAYAKREAITRSEAVRQLIERGLGKEAKKR